MKDDTLQFLSAETMHNKLEENKLKEAERVNTDFYAVNHRNIAQKLEDIAKYQIGWNYWKEFRLIGNDNEDFLVRKEFLYCVLEDVQKLKKELEKAGYKVKLRTIRAGMGVKAIHLYFYVKPKKTKTNTQMQDIETKGFN